MATEKEILVGQLFEHTLEMVGITDYVTVCENHTKDNKSKIEFFTPKSENSEQLDLFAKTYMEKLEPETRVFSSDPVVELWGTAIFGTLIIMTVLERSYYDTLKEDSKIIQEYKKKFSENELNEVDAFFRELFPQEKNIRKYVHNLLGRLAKSIRPPDEEAVLGGPPPVTQEEPNKQWDD